MGTWKNIIENSIQLILVFVGMGVYTGIVLKPILIESIRQETTKIETNIDSKIDNKFKRIDALNSKLDNAFPVTPTQIINPSDKNIVNNDSCVPFGYTVVKIDNLTKRQKKRLGFL